MESLQQQLQLRTTSLLTSSAGRQLIADLPNIPASSKLLKRRVERRLASQDAHAQQCLYRTCAGITTFRVRDPDPCAVDGGRVLGVRIEVVTRGRFLRPYFVLLNRPYGEATASAARENAADGPLQQQQRQSDEESRRTRARYLRVHRHTVPPCIPLAGLAARHLPPPPAAQPAGAVPEAATQQDLARFARALRREITRYHCRIGVIKDLRRAAGLEEKEVGEGEDGRGDEGGEGAVARRRGGRERQKRRSGVARGMVDIRAADAEAKQVALEWDDGRTGRLVVDDDGRLVGWAVFGGPAAVTTRTTTVRDRATVRLLVGDRAAADDVGEPARLEDVVRRLAGQSSPGG